MLMKFLFRFCGCQIGDSKLHKQLILTMFSQEYNMYIFTMTAKCCTKQECVKMSCNTKYKFYGDKQTWWYNLFKTKTIKINKMCEDFLQFHIFFFILFFLMMVNPTEKKNLCENSCITKNCIFMMTGT